VDSVYPVKYYSVTTETCNEYLYGKKTEKTELKREEFENELDKNPVRLIGKMDIRYKLDKEENTLLELYDLMDYSCHVLLNDRQTAGNYALSFEPQIDRNKSYLLSLTIGDKTYLRKLEE
jgi:hypothetical protein